MQKGLHRRVARIGIRRRAAQSHHRGVIDPARPSRLLEDRPSGPSPLAVLRNSTQSCIGPIRSTGLSDTITTTRKIDANGLLACLALTDRTCRPLRILSGSMAPAHDLR